MKRYVVYPDYNAETHWWLDDNMEDIFISSRENESGEWVKWEDVEKLLKEINNK